MSTEFLDIIFNVIGITGVALIIIAYYLLQTEKMLSDDLSYSVINLIGAILITISLFRFWNLASFIIEMFWIVFSIFGIVKHYRKKGGDVK